MAVLSSANKTIFSYKKSLIELFLTKSMKILALNTTEPFACNLKSRSSTLFSAVASTFFFYTRKSNFWGEAECF